MQINGAKMTVIISILISTYLLHRLCLWLESNGWLYYLNKKAGTGILGSTLQELNSFLNPSIQHTIQMKQNHVAIQRCNETSVPGDPIAECESKLPNK
jgi:hypothetical protein